MRSRVLIGSLFFLSLAVMWIIAVSMENHARNSTRKEFIDLLRREQRACLQANIVLEEYQESRNCATYGDILYLVINPES